MKNLKRAFLFTIVMTVFFTMSIPVFAAESTYNFNLPYPLPGSIRSTPLVMKVAGESPYVSPSKNTIFTSYFLSPIRLSSSLATDTITTSTIGKRSFTYYPGYGGVDQEYCLSAYPGVSGQYDPYNVSGTWSR